MSGDWTPKTATVRSHSLLRQATIGYLSRPEYFSDVVGNNEPQPVYKRM